MFLTELNIDEKKMFLELCYHAIEANGELKDNEFKIFKNFKYECALPHYEIKNEDFFEILSFFLKSKKYIHKIVIIELFGIFMADGEICDKEELFINRIIKEWDLSDAQLRRIKRWVMDCNDLLNDAYRLIGIDV